MTLEPKRARLAFADGIRGLAALWVVLFHASEGGHVEHLKAALPAWSSRLLFDWGHLGVALFFVLSGFVMMHSVRGCSFTPELGARFALRRLLRLTPPYYASIVFVVAYVAGKALAQGQHVALPSSNALAAHALYLQDVLSVEPLSVVYWTLCIEIQFYIAFVAFMLAAQWAQATSGRTGAARAVLALAAVAGLPWAFGWLTVPIYSGGFLSFWYCFMLGALVSAQAHDPRIRTFFWIYASVVAAAGAITGFDVTWAALVGTLLIVAGSRVSALDHLLNARVLQFLGLVSYSLYLTHNQTTGATMFVLTRFMRPGIAGELAALLAIVAASLLVASLGYWLVEKPSVEWSRRIRLAPRPPARARHRADALNPSRMRSIIISDDVPVETYGTGQRLLALKKGLEQLGECRMVWMRPTDGAALPPQADYAISGIVPPDAGRGWWVRRQLCFDDYRPHPELVRQVCAIRERFEFDIAVCSFFRNQSAAPHGVVPCFLDADALPVPDSLLRFILWPATRLLMRRAAARFNGVFVIRATDADIIDPRAAVTHLLPGISASVSASIEVNANASDILFVGSMGWAPNRAAADYLAETIAPSLGPDSTTRVCLVGQGTERYGGRPNVKGVGFAKSMEEHYRNARVVVCPIWEGSGANIKLAEAIQYGCAVVTTQHAASAFGGILCPGENVVTARDEAGFANELRALLQDPERLSELRRNAAVTGRDLLSQSHLNKIIATAVRSGCKDFAPTR